MRVTIHQPNFLPWLGFFDKVDQSDLFILLDNVQFEKNDWQNRNRIKGPDGAQWLTVPVYHKFPQTVAEVRIDNRTNWRRKHWNAIVSNYRKAAFFAQYAPQFESVYQCEWEQLIALNLHLLRLVFELTGIRTPCRLASEIPVDGVSSERLSALCEAAGANVYLAGAGGHDYLDTTSFDRKNIQVAFQSYPHPIYPQLFGEFVPYLSIFDLLMNCGDQSLSVIRGQLTGSTA